MNPVPIDTLGEIESLFHRLGDRRYAGESVSQLEHALQTAHAAERAGADDALVTAALLHDVGHFTDPGFEQVAGADPRHECRAVVLLSRVYGPDVLESIRLHVDAKRYLCAVDVGYRRRLSAGSVRSLTLQGGAFDAREAEAFEAQPCARTAIALRCWDDAAKRPGAVTPSLEHYLERARRCLLPASRHGMLVASDSQERST